MPQILDVKGAARANSYMLPPDQLLSGDNSRRNPDLDVDDLMQDIRVRGQLQPILIQWEKTGQLEIVDGHRRVEAIRRLNELNNPGAEPMKVRCEPYKGKREQSFQASVAANLQRKDLSPIDRAYDIQRMEKLGMTRQEIATLMGISEPLISRSLKLTTLPADIQRKVHKGEIASETAYELADMPKEERDEAVEASKAEARAAGKPEATARVQTKHTRKVRREKPEAEGPKGRTLREIRDDWTEMAAKAEEIGEKSAAVFKSLIDYAEGKIGIRAVLNRMWDLETV